MQYLLRHKLLYENVEADCHINRYSGEIPGGDTVDDTLVTSTLKKICIEGIQLFTDEFRFGPGGGRCKISPAGSTSCPGSSSSGAGSQGGDSDDDLDELLRPGCKREEGGSEPLPVACLTGRQELVVRFSETNQFGLPRSLEEVELNLGGVCLHMYPHQVYFVAKGNIFGFKRV